MHGAIVIPIARMQHAPPDGCGASTTRIIAPHLRICIAAAGLLYYELLSWCMGRVNTARGRALARCGLTMNKACLVERLYCLMYTLSVL